MANTSTQPTFSKSNFNSQSNNLTASDYENLERSYITPEVANAARIFRVDSHAGAELVGRRPKNNRDYSGIVFPNVWPEEARPREFRLRRDNPELEAQEDGSHKPKEKYLSPPGRKNLLYFAPKTPARWLTDTGIQAVITEGEKKNLALDRFFSERKEQALCIGLTGVWGFRGTIGKTTNENGARVDLKGVIPDFDRIEWQGRRVIIVYDVNVETNGSVAAARRELVLKLEQRGATVFILELPTDIPGVNGIDDLLAIKGSEFVSALFYRLLPASKAVDNKNKKASSLLVEIARQCELFHTAEKRAYANISIAGHRETYAIKSPMFKRWMSHQVYLQEGSIPSSQALQDAMTILESKALFEGQCQEVYLRIAKLNEAIYLDLCNSEWQAVKITPSGWEIVNNPPVYFRRTNGMLPLPLPERQGSIKELRDVLNFGTDENWTLLTAWLVAAFNPDIPYPVLIVHGGQGSAKSSACEMLRSLVDPNISPIRSFPKEERDLIISAQNSWMIGYDNCRRLTDSLSDTFCRLSTGGGFSARTLYEDDQETLFYVRRPLLLNGIEEIATQNDLIDRSVIVHLPSIPEDKRIEKIIVWENFERIRPCVLGALLDAVSVALRELPNVQLERKPRMADFAKWATAAETGLGFQAGDFMKVYAANRKEANEMVIEASSVAVAIKAFMDGKENWRGIYKDLLTELNKLTDEEDHKSKNWPKNSVGLSNAVKRLSPNLLATGIEIITGIREGKKGSRTVEIKNKGIELSACQPQQD